LIDTYPGGSTGTGAEIDCCARGTPGPAMSPGAKVGFWTCCHRSLRVPNTPPPDLAEPYDWFGISGTYGEKGSRDGGGAVGSPGIGSAATGAAVGAGVGGAGIG
jgi:hypothetical protein